MTDIHHLYRKIIAELTRLQVPGAWKDDTSIMPGLIWTGGQGSIAVNRQIDDDILRIAGWLLEQRPAAKSRHSLKEWRANVRSAFGPALIQLDLDADIEESGRKLKSLIEFAIDTEPTTVSCCYMTIGCTLLDQPLPSPLAIGPVRFEATDDWLDRAVQGGQISGTSRNRLQRAFNGQNLRPRKQARENAYERSIMDVLRSAQLACTVETQGLAPEMAQTRAIIGARLGQTAIALLWAVPSRVLDGFHLSVDHGPKFIRTIPFVPGRKAIGGSSRIGLPRGPSMSPESWNNLVNDARCFLDVAGSMIACWTSADAYDRASPLLRNLAQAIFFFWEGCRDENDLMAIVKFTAALEALAQGKSAGIVRLVTARLGFKEHDKIVGERTLRQVIELIYGIGRSRTLHGTNSSIHHDWSDTRGTTESLTRHCLVACIDWVEQNPMATDPALLLT